MKTSILVLAGTLLGLMLTSFIIQERKSIIEDEEPRIVILNSEQVQDSIKLFNGYNTVMLEFPNDTLEFLPTYPGYVVYSYLEDSPFPIDWLFEDDAKIFAWWSTQFPLLGDNREKPNEYYQELILEKIYE